MTCCSTGLVTAYTVTRPGRTVCYASCWRSRCCRLNISSWLSLPYPRPVFLMQLLLTNSTVSCRTSVQHGWRAQMVSRPVCIRPARTHQRVCLSASWFVGELVCRRVVHKPKNFTACNIFAEHAVNFTFYFKSNFVH